MDGHAEDHSRCTKLQEQLPTDLVVALMLVDVSRTLVPKLTSVTGGYWTTDKARVGGTLLDQKLASRVICKARVQTETFLGHGAQNLAYLSLTHPLLKKSLRTESSGKGVVHVDR